MNSIEVSKNFCKTKWSKQSITTYNKAYKNVWKQLKPILSKNLAYNNKKKDNRRQKRKNSAKLCEITVSQPRNNGLLNKNS